MLSNQGGGRSLFDQFYQYHDRRSGLAKHGLILREICSSFAILCYQIAYVKMIKYFSHAGYANIGPERRSTPTSTKTLFLDTDLFEEVGNIRASYAYNTLATVSRDSRILLERRASSISIPKHRLGAAEAPF